MNIKNIALTVGIVLVALFLIKSLNIYYPVHVISSMQSAELSVVGEGKVEVVPDIAYVDAGINVIAAATVDAARRTIDQTNNNIIDALKQFGIDKKDIKTSNYSINPNYTYDNNRNSMDGYNATANVSIKVRNVDQVSQIIEAVTTAGANQVNGVRFDVENPENYREMARNKAIENAREQAEKLAKNLGIKLGKVTNIVEGASGGPVPLYDQMSAKAGLGGGIAPDIEPGSQTITSVVTLYFEKR